MGLHLEELLRTLPPPVTGDTVLMFRAGLLLSELCSNITRHGRAGQICVSVRAGRASSIVLTVIDDGAPFDMTCGSSLPEDLYAESGRGLFLIREMASALAYRRLGGRNVHRVSVAG